MMESNTKILCILVLYFLQFSLPVQSVSCTTTNCASGDGLCDGDVCVCVAGNGGDGCGDTCTSCNPNFCTAAASCGDCASPCDAAGGACKSVWDFGIATPAADVRCVCTSGFTGTTCACPAACATNGVCDDDTCVCNSGKGGTACAEACDSSCTACEGTASTDCLPCASCTGIGQFCQTSDDAGTQTAACACKTGFTGAACGQCSDDANGCSGEGTCGTAAPNVGVCACDATHVGTFCQHECPTGAAACTAPKICVGNAGDTAAECGCTAGLSGAACTTVTCSPDDPCENGATCNTNKCDCAANYAGLTCQHDCSPACATGKVCTEKTDKTGAECTDGASSLLVTLAVLILGVWSSTKLY